MDKIAISGAANSSFDSHQAVFLGALKDRFRFELLGVSGLVDVGPYPTYVFAPPESPLL